MTKVSNWKWVFLDLVSVKLQYLNKPVGAVETFFQTGILALRPGERK
jgi:hypothetical protein